MSPKKNIWKACIPQKGIGGSNPPHSARNTSIRGVLTTPDDMSKWSQIVAKSGILTENKPKTKMRHITVNLYLRNSYPNADGTSPLCIAVNFGGSTSYIATGVRLHPSQWDKEKRKVINHPKHQTYNSVLASTIGRAQDVVIELTRRGGLRGLKVTQVRDMIYNALYPAAPVDCSVVAVFRHYLETLGKDSTRRIYGGTLTKVEMYQRRIGGTLQFADITPQWLADFDKWLVGYCPAVNSRGIHMRNLRAVFNYAVAEDLTSAPYPFKKFKIKRQITTPNALTIEQLHILLNHQPANAVDAYWLDMFRLTFALIGINMADLWGLERIVQGRINYTRQKTGRVYSIKVEQVAKDIISRHKGRKTLVDVCDRYKDAHIATTQANRRLKAMAVGLGLPPVTMYTARYSWASVAASLDVPIEVISQALGHTYGMAVTLGYIAPDRRKVDAANVRVLEAVFGG